MAALVSSEYMTKKKMAADADAAVGRRVICDGQYGTVKFFGDVPPASGLWYGIEWDEDGRGKHSGEREGVKYFECSRPGSGSFVRAQKRLDFGVGLVEALMRKFDNFQRGEEDKEQHFDFLGCSRDKEDNVEEKLQQLKHVSLRWTNVSRAKNGNSLGNIAPNIVELDLAKTLLSDWQEVLNIVKDLPRLTELNISETRLGLESIDTDNRNVAVQFPLKTLVANKMNLNWQQILAMASTFGGLEELHAGFNNIQCLKSGNLDSIKKVQRLNLEGNELSDWSQVLLLQVLPVLETLVLSDNNLDDVLFPGSINETPDAFCNLKSLSLSKTLISSWSSIHQLNRLSTLETLVLKDCPVVNGISEYEARQELIARIANCLKLNKSRVTVKERQAAERAYLKMYGKEWLASGGSADSLQSKADAGFVLKHPRYLSLLETHGIPEGLGMSVSTGSALKDNLVVVTVTCVNDPAKSVTKKLPRTMTISKLKGLLQRLFKILSVRQSLSYVDQAGHKIEMDDDLRTLSFYSIESGDTICLTEITQ